MPDDTDLRLRHAHLLAAARAAVTAARDGEPDALAYLADELAAQGQLPPADPAHPWPSDPWSGL